MDVATDVTADVAVKLLTYGELAEALAIKRESARQLVIRKHWERRKGNDGRARIAVPLAALPDPSARPSNGADAEPSDEASELRARVHELATSTLRLKLVEVEAELRVRTSELEAERRITGELRQRSDELRTERDDWKGQAQSLALTIPSAKQTSTAQRRAWWKWWARQPS